MPLLLISGRPGAGKSTFCRWLEANRGYAHVEADRDSGKWLGLLGAEEPSALIEELVRYGTDVAFEVGYAPDLIPGVERASKAGVEIWWFDGDPEAAKENFVNRDEPIPLPEFDAQVALIEQGRAMIEATYEGRILDVVRPGPDNAAPEDILAWCRLD